MKLWVSNKLSQRYPGIPNLTLQVQWVPLPLVHSKAQFAVCFMDTTCMDILIDGQTITVTQISPTSTYRILHLTSCEEFQLLVQTQMLAMIKQLTPSQHASC